MCLHTFNGRSVGRIALSEEGLVGAGHTFPALVAIHGKVPAVTEAIWACLPSK